MEIGDARLSWQPLRAEGLERNVECHLLVTATPCHCAITTSSGELGLSCQQLVEDGLDQWCRCSLAPLQCTKAVFSAAVYCCTSSALERVMTACRQPAICDLTKAKLLSFLAATLFDDCVFYKFQQVGRL